MLFFVIIAWGGYMERIRKVVKKDTLFLSFLSTMIIVTMGNYVIPLAFRNIKNTGQAIAVLLVGVFFMFLFIIGSSQLLWHRLRLYLELESLGVWSGWKGNLRCFTIVILGWLLLSLVYGLVSVGLYLVTKDTMTLGQVKGIFNFISTAITVLVLPCSIHLVYRQGLRCGKTKEGVTLKQTYLKILGIVVSLFAMGHLIALGFLYIERTVFVECIKIVILSMVGSVAICSISCLYGDLGKVR